VSGLPVNEPPADQMDDGLDAILANLDMDQIAKGIFIKKKFIDYFVICFFII